MRQYTIDRDTRTLILKYIAKYDEYLLRYEAEKYRAIYPGVKLSDMPKGSDTSNPTLSAAQRLEEIEQKHYVRVIKAIDQAKGLIGNDVPDDRAREALRRAIWLSCLNRTDYPFEVFGGTICCERATFYRYKNEFLNHIKGALGL